MSRLLIFIAALAALTGCATVPSNIADGIKPLVAKEELGGSELLDVAIVTFESKELTDEQLTELGLSQEIRQAEERYIPIHLKYTMQRTGYWGVVRVVPQVNSAHLLVRGQIVHSDGERLTVEITAYDSRNIKWFEKTYSDNLKLADYGGVSPGEHDPYQDLYTTIANDLAEQRATLTTKDIEEIQDVSMLRLASAMAPDAFSDHLAQNEEGRYSLVRKPAESDPMLKRVSAIRARDEMLLDTINSYYELYYNDLWQPYTDWRRLYNEEVVALRKVQKEATLRKLFGLASIVGGVLLSSNNSVNSSNLPGVMVVGGAAAIYSGFQKSEETKIHKEVIEELSISFASEAEPLVVEVVGETVRLTGSAEEQYSQWRKILRDIYAQETGLPTAPANSEVDASASDHSMGAM
jgi:hypothetical protein